MKYAITFESNTVFQHFGKCQEFLFVHIEQGVVTSKEVVNTNGSGHSALVAFLKNAEIETVVCGGIGQGARNALKECGIALIAGAQGHVDIILNKLCKGTLEDNPSGVCNHQHEEGHAHPCGETDHCH